MTCHDEDCRSARLWAEKRITELESNLARLETAVTLARDMIARLESENEELKRRCAALAEIESVVARGGR